MSPLVRFAVILVDGWIIGVAIVEVGVTQPRFCVDDGVVLRDGLMMVVYLLGRWRSFFWSRVNVGFLVVVVVMWDLRIGDLSRVVVVVVRWVVSPMLTVMAVHPNVHHHHFHGSRHHCTHVTWQALDCLCDAVARRTRCVSEGGACHCAGGNRPIRTRPHGDDLMLDEGLVWIQPSLCCLPGEHFNPSEWYKCQLLCVTWQRDLYCSHVAVLMGCGWDIYRLWMRWSIFKEGDGRKIMAPK